MNNPWKDIKLSDYENHMKLDTVMQLQVLNERMKAQFEIGKASSILILGVAGGNGLEHIDVSRVKKLYVLDINKEYLKTCKQRYPMLNAITTYLCEDLTDEEATLPYAELIVANLLIEYIGYECFQNVVKKVSPKAVSCIIQVNGEENFVSQSPYVHAFDQLDCVHHNVEEKELSLAMKAIGYELSHKTETLLPNGKKLIQLDFIKLMKNLIERQKL